MPKFSTIPKHVKIVVITAPTFSGKSFFMNLLCEYFPNSARLTSITTRAMRANETPGNTEYTFVSVSEFEAMHERGELLWRTQNRGDWYGTRVADVAEAHHREGVTFTLLRPEHAKKLKSLYPDSVIAIYLYVPKRLRLALINKNSVIRGESDEKIRKGLQESAEWDKLAKSLKTVDGRPVFDAIVRNDNKNNVFSPVAHLCGIVRLAMEGST